MTTFRRHASAMCWIDCLVVTSQAPVTPDPTAQRSRRIATVTTASNRNRSTSRADQIPAEFLGCFQVVSCTFAVCSRKRDPLPDRLLTLQNPQPPPTARDDRLTGDPFIHVSPSEVPRPRPRPSVRVFTVFLVLANRSISHVATTHSSTACPFKLCFCPCSCMLSVGTSIC